MDTQAHVQKEVVPESRSPLPWQGPKMHHEIHHRVGCAPRDADDPLGMKLPVRNPVSNASMGCEHSPVLETRLDGSPRELVERARSGDEQAFSQLVAAHQRSALAIAYAILGDAAAAGDVMQETFLRAWQKLRDLDDPDRFGAWIGRIARNLAHDHVRRQPRDLVPLEDQQPVYPRLAEDPANLLDRGETRRTINAALGELDETTRTAIALRYYQNMSSKQIAEVLDLTPAAVDMRLSRGRAELRKKLTSLAAT
jgi:RNA polymerase sigma-70 factor (ECF subfamily)